MKLAHSYWSKDVTWNIEEAVEDQTSSDGEQGALEETESSLKRTREFLGKLVALLHANGTLSDAYVLQLLSKFEEVK